MADPKQNLSPKPESQSPSRRDFLKLAAAGLGGLLLIPNQVGIQAAGRLAAFYAPPLPEFPKAERLGRAAKGSLEVRTRPDPGSQLVKTVYEDTVLPWLREVSGVVPNLAFSNQRWVETDGGYVYAPFFQPVQYRPNSPVQSLPQSSLGQGMWVEVTVPYVDVALETDPSENSWVKARVDEGLALRLYYSQVFWVDKIKLDDQGQVIYRINPNYYGGVDMLWGAGEAFRPLTVEDLAPVSPDVEDKRIQVDVTYQTLSCFESQTEVYFCRVSTGAKFDMYGNTVDKWLTPVGGHTITRKFISLQMSGGATGAPYDIPGIGWTSIFATGGVAIHSTFWHNNYGDPMSHGCVNVAPKDAQWIFRWAQPGIPADPGMMDITLTGTAGTHVEVVES